MDSRSYQVDGHEQQHVRRGRGTDVLASECESEQCEHGRRNRRVHETLHRGHRGSGEQGCVQRRAEQGRIHEEQGCSDHEWCDEVVRARYVDDVIIVSPCSCEARMQQAVKCMQFDLASRGQTQEWLDMPMHTDDQYVNLEPRRYETPPAWATHRNNSETTPSDTQRERIR